MLGQTISHYRITDKLGAGGMGVVYKAVDLKLERTVALKFLPHDVAVADQDKERLLREARSASALDHPNIGVIYGLEESEDHQLFIVMRYYEGETLAQKIARGPIPLRESLELAIQIAGGLAAAHARNIVHRDVKPSNTILTKDDLVKIVDFGLARVVAGSSATLSLNTSGTLPYMAPEQVLGEPVDQHADVWALGVILVQMLTGSHPFLRENTASMTFAILNQPPAGLEAIPAFLQPIAYRALSKDAKHRYSNAKEMLADLEAARAQLISSSGSTELEGPTLAGSASAREVRQWAEHASTPRWAAAQPRKLPNWPYVTAAVVVLAAVSLLFPPVRERISLLATSGGEKHIAVLPFDNIGNDPANEPVAEGLMDSLTSKLSNLDAAQQSLWVVPSSVVRNRHVTDPSAAFRELGANLVVKGSIQRTGKAIQLTVNLIDAKRMRQIGSAALEDPAGDLATLQDETVARLGRLMNLDVSAGMLRDTGGSAAPAAYESYLKALGYIQRYDKPGNLDKAIASLNSAVQTDPQFALGFASLGQAYQLRYIVDQNPKWIEEASAYCKRAVELDDRLPSAYVTLGRIHDSAGRFDLAVQEFQKALQLDARNADALNGLANAYEKAGRAAEAEAAFRKAADLRPDYWDVYNALGLFYDRQRRYAESIGQLRHAIELTPDNAQIYLNLGAVYLDTNDKKEIPDAEAALRESIQLNPSYAAYANLGFLYLQEKQYAEAAAAIEKALAFNRDNYLVWDTLAASYDWLKNTAASENAREHELALLENAVKAKPDDAQAQSTLAILYAQKQLKDRAMTRLRVALALAPDDPNVLENAGEICEDLGDRRQALEYVKKGLAKGLTLEDLGRNFALQGLLSDPSFRLPPAK